MDFRDKQIAPPKSWDTFEDLSLALFRSIWRDPFAAKNGRQGQPQHGVDVFGTPDGNGALLHGVQCKGKDQTYGRRVTLAELKREIKKAEKFEPRLKAWFFATTAPKDGELQKAARVISKQRQRKGLFSVRVLGWEDIQGLMAAAPKVIEQFYPEHAFDIPGLLSALRAIPSGAEVRAILASFPHQVTVGNSVLVSAWETISFGHQRDLGPALMGRPLGPADAASCPQLPEVEIIVRDLERAYFSRLIGESGGGKSVCALQAAKIFSDRGWNVLRLLDPAVESLEFNVEPDSQRTLYLIDDAHLLPAAILRQAESNAGERRLILSTHNAMEHSAGVRGSIVMDAKRGVGVIAAALRSDIHNTLKIVKRIDDGVGDRPFDESIEWRIDNAEKEADRPWQFCFILGGGWRRAKDVASVAKAKGADLVLAAAAIRQIATRDARCSKDELRSMVQSGGIPLTDIDAALGWLISERLLVGHDDCRTPHQRFGGVVLKQILLLQNDVGLNAIGSFLRYSLSQSSYPLAGLRLLLSEIRMAGPDVRPGLVKAEWVRPLIARCWAASGDDLPAAIFLISETSEYGPKWPRAALDRHKTKVRKWVSEPPYQGGYAVSQLLNSIHHADASYGVSIMDGVDIDKLASTITNATARTAFDVSKLLNGVFNTSSKQFRNKLSKRVVFRNLKHLAANWPDSEYLSGFAHLCHALQWVNRSSALDVLEKFIPIAARALNNDPAHTYNELTEITWHVLKGFDPLGVYVGKHAQTSRDKSLCKKICSLLDPVKLASRLSEVPKRDLQPAAFFLRFVQNADHRKFSKIVQLIDWKKIDGTIGDDWKRMFHEAEVFLQVCSGDKIGAASVDMLISNRVIDVEIMPPKLAFLSPRTGHRQLDSGRLIGVSTTDHKFRWLEAAVILLDLIPNRPDLVEIFLEPHLASASETLSMRHPSWYQQAGIFFQVIRQAAPHILTRILDNIDLASARVGWELALKGKTETRRPIALILNFGRNRKDNVGRLIRALLKKYPAYSKPAKRDLEKIVFR